MMTREGFECYKLYLALQRHFSSSYDYFKYKGGVSATTDAYNKRPDFFAFEKMAKIIPEGERVDFFVAHFIENSKEWIRNMSKVKYDEWKHKTNMMPNSFKIDLEFLYNDGMETMFRVDGDIPRIHKHAINKDITIESVIILDSIFPFIDKHKEQVSVPFVWPEHVQRLTKYRPFILEKIGQRPLVYRETAKSVLVS